MPHLLGLATAVPDNAITQSDAAAMAQQRCTTDARQARILERLYQRTTVEQRGSTLLKTNDTHRVDEHSFDWFFPRADESPKGPTTSERMAQFAQLAPPLAIRACRNALADADTTPDQVTHLITVTCTGFGSPGVEHQVIEKLGLPDTVSRTHIGFMGCHAALNGLAVARAFAAANPNARVLLHCVELCTLHFQYAWHPDQMVANALFADGAAAVVVGGANAPQPPNAWAIKDTASTLLADSSSDMTWRIGDHGFEMTLSSRVPQIISKSVKPWLEPWLAGHGLTLSEIATFAIHAGGPRIVSATAQALGLADNRVDISATILREHGNMSSATLLFILNELRKRQAPTPCVALSFGPGLAAEAALLTA